MCYRYIPAGVLVSVVVDRIGEALKCIYQECIREYLLFQPDKVQRDMYALKRIPDNRK